MIVVRAPLRISFGGGGTDLPAYYERFGGFVVSSAITAYCSVIATTSSDKGIHITSADYQVHEVFNPGVIPPLEEPLCLPKAAIHLFADDLRIQGVHLLLASDVPPGTGLGSSSALAVALVHALAAYLHRPLNPAEAAELACRLEIDQLSKPIGKQDQYASAFGGINAIDFQRDEIRVAPLQLFPKVVHELGERLVLFSSGKSRDSAHILAQQQRDTAGNDKVADALHAIKALAKDMRTALMSGDVDGFGRLLDQSWRHKRSLSGRISTHDIDTWYQIARDAGALGGKITGAGGGGFLLLCCAQGKQEAVRDALGNCGLQEMPFDFDFEGARLMTMTEDMNMERMTARIGGWKQAATPASHERCGREGFRA